MSNFSYAADQLRFQLDWLPGGDKTALYVCKEGGFCANENIDIVIMPGRGSTDSLTKVATGVADMGVTDLGTLMSSASSDKVPAKAVFAVYSQAPHTFYSLTKSNIKVPQDIKGKKVSSSPFTSSNMFLPLFLEANGMTMDDITTEHIDASALGPVLATGNTDVIIGYITDFSRYREQAKNTGNDVNAMQWSSLGLDIYSNVIVASDDFIAKNPDIIKRFLSAYVKSVDFMRENPEEATRYLVKNVPELGFDYILPSVKASTDFMFNEETERLGFGKLTPEKIKFTWEVITKATKIDRNSLDPMSVVNSNFYKFKD